MSFSAFTAINCLNTINMMNTTTLISRTMMQANAAAMARRSTAAYLARRQSPIQTHSQQPESGARPYLHFAERLELERQKEFHERFHREIQERIWQSMRASGESQEAKPEEVKPATVGPFLVLPPEKPKGFIGRITKFLFS